VNLAIGNNATNFNISLVEGFNQTGAGVFCLKEAGKNAIMEGFAASNISMDSMDGMNATVQIIQIGHSGSSLYNVSLDSCLWGRVGYMDDADLGCSVRISHSTRQRRY